MGSKAYKEAEKLLETMEGQLEIVPDKEEQMAYAEFLKSKSTHWPSFWKGWNSSAQLTR